MFQTPHWIPEIADTVDTVLKIGEHHIHYGIESICLFQARVIEALMRQEA